MDTYDDIIRDLREQLQKLEDLKTSITETQEDVRATMYAVEMMKEADAGGGQ